MKVQKRYRLARSLFKVFAFPVRSSTWTSWSLLVIMTFMIVVHLKHLKESVNVPD
jgi:uncharacterized membrane protein YoaT (DUF817 family)